MKIIIAGGRDFNNYPVAEQVLNQYKSQIDEVVCGDAKGADTIGAHWANYNSIPVKHFPAKWNQYGKRAGYLRNEEMGNYADALIAFWDGSSRGTRNMIDIMRNLHKPCAIFNYEGIRYETLD